KVTRVSLVPWVAIALAVGSYGGLHWYATRSLPNRWGFGPTNQLLIEAMLRGLAIAGQYIVPMCLLVFAVASLLGRRKRAKLLVGVANSQSVDAINAMTWREFEMLVGEAFRVQGYGVVETADGADGGVDLVLRKDSEKYFVQCKQWRAQSVGVPMVRELYGAMAAHGATGGFVVTSGRFTRPAVEFAEGRNLTLIDGPQLHAMIRSTSGALAQEASVSVPMVAEVPPNPMCPSCARPMAKRTARQGAKAGQSFWGCTGYPSCRGILELV
ncbi:MAG: restriction endonuclease, partial [Propionibacteriaceae bacterium]